MNEMIIKRQLHVEQLISDVARKFVMLEDVEEAINVALEKIGLFSGACRAYIFEFDLDNDVMHNTFEWCSEGVSQEIDNLQNLPIDLFPWWVGRLRNGEVLNIRDVSRLGLEASAEKEILEAQQIKSVLVLPLFIKGTLNGFVGFDNTESYGQWTDDDQTILNVTSELFSSAFARMLYAKQLADTNHHLESTLEELKRTQSHLVRQEQMVAIGQLAAGVAHEINNPLGFMLSNQGVLKNYIIHLNEVLERSEELTDRISQEDDLVRIKEEVATFKKRLKDAELDFIRDDLKDLMEDVDLGIQRVSKIVEGLRYFSYAGDNGITDNYSLVEGIENTLIVAGSRLRGVISIEKSYEEGLPTLQCKGNEINQVLLNLIMNAADAMEGIEDRTPTIHISVTKDEHFVTCTVEDNGCGMTEEVAGQVFNPFFTTKSIGSGTGLGMSIAYDIVKKNGGTIDLTSTPDRGTAFTLKLRHDRQ